MKTVLFTLTFCLKRGMAYNFLDYVLNIKENWKAIIRAYRKHPFEMKIKFHPGDPHTDLVKGILNKESISPEYISDNKTAVEAIKDCDFLVSDWSTCAIEGRLSKKPVILMEAFINSPNMCDFVKDGLVEYASNPEKLEELLLKHLEPAVILT